MAVAQLATLEEYAALYGEPQDAARVGALLARASAYLAAFMPGYEPGVSEVMDTNVSTVCCDIVHRCTSAPDGPDGMRQFTQTAGSYSMSLSFGEQYMRLLPSERELLGISQNSCVVAGARMAVDEWT